jgi:MSHA pilin protein MshD
MCTELRGSETRQSGFTLIELLMFIIIVGVSITGILSVMNVTVKSSADPVVRKQAMAMAEAIMDEVLAKDFANPPGGFTDGSGTCVNRIQYDDVSDYDCFKTSSANRISGTSTLGSTSIPGMAAYSASVDIDAATSKLGLTGGTEVKTITVTVTGNGQTIQFIGYRTNY